MQGAAGLVPEREEAGQSRPVSIAVGSEEPTAAVQSPRSGKPCIGVYIPSKPGHLPMQAGDMPLPCLLVHLSPPHLCKRATCSIIVFQ